MTGNPLLPPPRERVVELYPGDIEARLAELREIMSDDVTADKPAKPRRNSDKPVESPADAAAKEYDQIVADARDRAVKVRLKAVPQRTFDQLRDDHPAREDNKRDEALGFNTDTLFWPLIRAALVDPVTDTQWAEFEAQCVHANFNKLATAAYELALEDVALPKSSAVSVLRRMRDSASTQQPDSE